MVLAKMIFPYNYQLPLLLKEKFIKKTIIVKKINYILEIILLKKDINILKQELINSNNGSANSRRTEIIENFLKVIISRLHNLENKLEEEKRVIDHLIIKQHKLEQKIENLEKILKDLEKV